MIVGVLLVVADRVVVLVGVDVLPIVGDIVGVGMGP